MGLPIPFSSRSWKHRHKKHTGSASVGSRPAFAHVPNPRACLPRGTQLPHAVLQGSQQRPQPPPTPFLGFAGPPTAPVPEPSRGGPWLPTPRRRPSPKRLERGRCGTRAGGRRTAPGRISPARPARHLQTGSRKPWSPAASTVQDSPASLRRAAAAAAARAFCCRGFSRQRRNQQPTRPLPAGRCAAPPTSPAPEEPRPTEKSVALAA